MAIDVKTLAIPKGVPIASQLKITMPQLASQIKTTKLADCTTPSVSPSVIPKKYSTPLPYVPKKACEHVWAEAFNVRTGKSYKRCLYCKERIEEVKTRIVRIKL